MSNVPCSSLIQAGVSRALKATQSKEFFFGCAEQRDEEKEKQRCTQKCHPGERMIHGMKQYMT